MASKAQSWSAMSLSARLYIGVIVALGSLVLLAGAMPPTGHQPIKFACYLLVAVAASRLKVNLPAITGTMSVNFLFILLGVLELSLTETLVLGTAALLIQCFYRDRPSALQVTFNICASAFSIAVAYGVYHFALSQGRIKSHPSLLVIAASTYFI